ARYLSETRRFDGVVNLIFQPAEEGLGGAKAMLADGLFDRFPCDVVFGFHNTPNLPIGKFAIRPGPMMAGGAFFDIIVKGKG
ncbi:M20/M25/M40 family metallo-hydrolase, partial [Escherichia coli]|uniref:M20/M25/M40 family metallo-hydrolase n=1 Tax=Escherichia coli TaxID=562 RepID=UPI0013D56EB7